MGNRMRFGAAIATAGAIACFTATPVSASSIEKQDPTVHSMDMNRASKGEASRRPRSSPLLTYHGGAISAAPRVFIVYWGTQWGTITGGDGITSVSLSNDPSSMAPYQQHFLSGLYGANDLGDTWSTSTTQYCQSGTTAEATGATTCATGTVVVGHPSTSPLAGVWADNGSSAPSQPTQSQLAAEAVRAANHFAAAGGFVQANDQVVVSTAHGNNSSGFGTQYCAWHSSTGYNGGYLAYTNMPYIPDAGGSCGANFVNKNGTGPLDGVSIVGGHEYAETITDMFPNGGWLDGNGAENGDKCAWISSGQGASADVTFPTGVFPVQSLWSNSFNSGAGGCVISYKSTGQS